MVTISSVAELSYRQVFPNPLPTQDITIEEFIETAKLLYVRHTWDISRLNKAENGFGYTNPNMLSIGEIEINGNNEADISELNTMDYFNGTSWIQQIGSDGMDCEGCGYTLYDLAKYRVLCNDKSANQRKKPVLLVGKKLLFPNGAWNKTEVIVYVGNGAGLNDELEIDGLAASFVRQSLVDLYLGKKGKEDNTNNNNSNN